jgi:CheY-like chemotaxis protein
MILLVDDDNDVRETSADMLEELGYQVIQAASGEEALTVLETEPELEVMVTDIRMPGMSGLELSELARARRQDLKIILVSGYFVQQPIKRRFLQKPFRTHELDQAIQAELSAA